MQYIDLSITIQSNMPYYPGDPAPSVAPALTIAEDGCHVMHLNIGSHTGTHVDAPSHFIPGGKTIDTIPLDRFIGRGLIISLPNLNEYHSISLADISPYADKLADADIVLFHTGWMDKAGTDAFYKHPVISKEVAKLLAASQIKAVGVDMLNVDKTCLGEELYAEGSMAAHEILLGNDILIIENLTNLSAVDFDNPTILFFPLAICGGDGSPVRAIATDIPCPFN